ncbi:MAG TPA: hypothetical protein VN581_11945 [Patescibacteria group bacterium]|nr:hypothetical protein [Patescibacteria group bacterium]
MTYEVRIQSTKKMKQVHRTLYFLVACVVCALFLSGCTNRSVHPAESELSAFEQFYLYRFKLSEPDHIAQLRVLYEQTVRPKIRSSSLAIPSNPELLSLFDAASIAFGFGEGSDTLADMAMAAEILEQRGAASARIWRRMYIAHMRSGNAVAANLARRKYGEHAESQTLVELPPINESTKTVVRTGGNGQVILSPVNLESGRQIVVIAHPLCGFSQRAVQFLEAHTEFSRLFESDVLWTVHPSSVAEFDVIREWNDLHPKARIAPATNTRQWPEIETGWPTPSIYFFENGQLRDKIVGFNERFEPDLRAAISKFNH